MLGVRPVHIYVWGLPKYIEFRSVLISFYSSVSKFVVLFLPVFLSDQLQTLAH